MAPMSRTKVYRCFVDGRPSFDYLEVRITSYGTATETPDMCTNCGVSFENRKAFRCTADGQDHWVCGDCISIYDTCKQAVFGVQRHSQKEMPDDWKGFSELRAAQKEVGTWLENDGPTEGSKVRARSQSVADGQLDGHPYQHVRVLGERCQATTRGPGESNDAAS